MLVCGVPYTLKHILRSTNIRFWNNTRAAETITSKNLYDLWTLPKKIKRFLKLNLYNGLLFKVHKSTNSSNVTIFCGGQLGIRDGNNVVTRSRTANNRSLLQRLQSHFGTGRGRGTRVNGLRRRTN